MSKVQFDPEVYSKMQIGEPYKTYRKTILGQVYVTVLDPFSGEPVGQILRGDPKKNEEGCIIDMWSEREDVFFKRMNRRQFELGNLIVYKRPLEEPPKSVNEFTDEELSALLDTRYFLKLQAALNKMTSIAPVSRLLQIAEDREKSEKFVNAIKARMSELQKVSYEVNKE